MLWLQKSRLPPEIIHQISENFMALGNNKKLYTSLGYLRRSFNSSSGGGVIRYIPKKAEINLKKNRRKKKRRTASEKKKKDLVEYRSSILASKLMAFGMIFESEINDRGLETHPNATASIHYRWSIRVPGGYLVLFQNEMRRCFGRMFAETHHSS